MISKCIQHITKENLLLMKDQNLKNKIYKYMTSISKNVQIDILANIVNEYNNTYHSKIKMKLVHLNSSTWIDFSKGNSGKDPKFEVADHVRISKY